MSGGFWRGTITVCPTRSSRKRIAPGVTYRSTEVVKHELSKIECRRLWRRRRPLDEKIKARGFKVSPEEVKRKFYGPATRDAVRECQTCHGLDVTGEVNEATAALLLTPVAGGPAHPIAAAPRSRNELAASALSSGGRTEFRPITPPLRRNDEGEDVINLQDCLQLMF
jgi:Putative peptidoglycan binding domain